MNPHDKPNHNKSQPLENRLISKKISSLTAGFLLTLVGLSSCELPSRTSYPLNEKTTRQQQQQYSSEDMRGRIYRGVNLYLQKMPDKERIEILQKYGVKLADNKKQLFQEKYPWINPNKLSDVDKLVIEFNFDAREIKEINEAYQKTKKILPDISAKWIKEFDEIRKKYPEKYQGIMSCWPWIDSTNPSIDDKVFIMNEAHSLRDAFR